MSHSWKLVTLLVAGALFLSRSSLAAQEIHLSQRRTPTLPESTTASDLLGTKSERRSKGGELFVHRDGGDYVSQLWRDHAGNQLEDGPLRGSNQPTPKSFDSAFPAPPQPPSEGDKSRGPAIADELFFHGGSYLYNPEGERLGWPEKGEASFEYLRLPQSWIAPEPITAFSDFLGADPVRAYPRPQLFNGRGTSRGDYAWDPRFVAYGQYSLVGIVLEQSGRRQDLLGHQLIAEFDLRLTGTERFHVQYRPIGERNTGGSFYQFNDPQGYEDNSTAEPDRFWFEGELHSLLGWSSDPQASMNWNIAAGKFPLLLHNALLINDDILGVVLSRNNTPLANTSNFNMQYLLGFNDIDTYQGTESQLAGLHASIDFKRIFYEATYCFVPTERDRDSHFLAFAGTRFVGVKSFAARVLFKFGDSGGTGNGQLVSLESNRTTIWESHWLGVSHSVSFCNAFWASQGWNSIAGGNFNRVRTAFEVNPLTRLAGGPVSSNTLAIAAGIQMFRHHEDESLVPEVAWERPDGDDVFGIGVRYLRKTSRRSFFELLGIYNRSSNPLFERDGILASQTWLL